MCIRDRPCGEEELVVYRTPPADAGALAAPRPRPPPNDDAPERDEPEPEPEPEPRDAPEPEPEPEPPPREAPEADPAPRGAREPDRSPRRPPPEDGRPPPAASSAMAVGVTCAATSPTSFTNAGEPARTACGVAVILASRVSARKSPACSGSTRVTTSPPDPARAVRPARCRYALCSAGGSTCTTSSIASTWMPRAAMSVATITRTAPVEKASRLRSRAGWLRFPCRSTAGMPAAVSCLASFLACLLYT